VEILTSMELATGTVGPVGAGYVDQDRLVAVHPGACLMHASYMADELDS
jgi:hypothetical protein